MGVAFADRSGRARHPPDSPCGVGSWRAGLTAADRMTKEETVSQFGANVLTYRALPARRMTTARVLLGTAAAGAFISFVL